MTINIDISIMELKINFKNIAMYLMFICKVMKDIKRNNDANFISNPQHI